jgi:hypothetical protein
MKKDGNLKLLGLKDFRLKDIRLQIIIGIILILFVLVLGFVSINTSVNNIIEACENTQNYEVINDGTLNEMKISKMPSPPKVQDNPLNEKSCTTDLDCGAEIVITPENSKLIYKTCLRCAGQMEEVEIKEIGNDIIEINHYINGKCIVATGAVCSAEGSMVNECIDDETLSVYSTSKICSDKAVCGNYATADLIECNGANNHLICKSGGKCKNGACTPNVYNKPIGTPCGGVKGFLCLNGDCIQPPPLGLA